MRRRRFGRRFFRRRKPTHWLTALVGTWDGTVGDDRLIPQPVADPGTGLPIFHSVELPLVTLLDIRFHGGEALNIRRIVGDLEFLYVDDTEQIIDVPREGAEFRFSVQTRRVYGQSEGGAVATALGSPIGIQAHSHLFRNAELGDEDLCWTGRARQPSRFSEDFVAVIGDVLDSRRLAQDSTLGAPITTFDTRSNFWFDQSPESRGISMRGFDLSLNRRLDEDNLLFLYIDITNVGGSTIAPAGIPRLLFNGYLRLLAQKGR